MKFRTEIEIAPLGTKIGYENRILALGSCFAEHIAGRLAQAKFRVTANPTGILFNPLSIAAALRSYAGEKPVRHSELGFDGELWFHYGFHGSFPPGSGPSPRGDERRPEERSRSAARGRPDRADLRHGVGLRTRRRGGRQLPPPARRGVHAAQAGRGRNRHRLSQTSWQVRSAAGR